MTAVPPQMSTTAIATAAPKVRRSGFGRRLLAKPTAIASLAWTLVAVVCGVFASLLAPFDPLQQDLLNARQLPGSEHLLGTDQLGRDILSRVMWGAGPTLLGVIEAIAVAVLVGVVVGVVAGYLGGRTDRFIVQVIDLVLALPGIILLLTVLTVFQRDMLAAMITLGILHSAGVARIIRSAAMSVRNELYIDAARISGLNDAAIIAWHVFPRVTGPIVIQISLFGAVAVLVQTGLSFLGLGVQPPQPTWGNMIYDASTVIGNFPWMLVPSGGVVALTILAFGLLGDAARDAAAEGWSTPRRRRPRVKAPSAYTPTSDEEKDAHLRVHNLTIVAKTSDGDRTLVDDVSFTLRRGEVLGVVGESGSGKTLTALSLLGLLPSGVEVEKGTLGLDGRNVDIRNERSIKPLRGKRISMIFQEASAALDPAFTVEDQLSEVIRRHDTRKNVHQRVIELLQQVRINDPEDVAKRYIHQISGGMAQRVGIARALASRPDILLADEPTTALDVTVQAEILDLLRLIRDEHGMSIVLVTHDWGVVADICDRALVLYRGVVRETGDVEQIFYSPRDRYTQALLKANPHAATPGETLPTIQDMFTETDLESGTADDPDVVTAKQSIEEAIR